LSTLRGARGLEGKVSSVVTWGALDQKCWIRGHNIHFEIRLALHIGHIHGSVRCRADVVLSTTLPFVGKITASYITAFHRADRATE
jgi:hypothetical protein